MIEFQGCWFDSSFCGLIRLNLYFLGLESQFLWVKTTCFIMFVGHTRHCLMVLILMVCSFDHGEAGGCRTAGLHNFTSGWSKTSKTHSFLRCVVPLTMGIHMILLSLFIIKNTPPIGTQGDYELEVHGLSGKEFSKKNVKHRWIVGGEYCVQTMEKACGCWAWMARSGLLRMWIIMRSLSFLLVCLQT